MNKLEEKLKDFEWLADDGPGSYTDEAYRAMPGEIKKLLAALRRCREQRAGYRENYWALTKPCYADMQEILDDDDTELLALLTGDEK